VARRQRDKKIGEAVELGKRQIVGRRLIRLLQTQLEELRQVETHGNRVLHYDHVVVAHLIAFFNPVMETLRVVENVFAQPRVQRLFKLPAVKRSTLSDAQRLFDPALLQPLVADLARRVERAPRADTRLDKLTRQIVAVDATFFEVAARILWALPHNPTSSRGSMQMCLHFDVLDGVPRGFTLLGGHEHEGPEFARNIQANTLYLLDRAYQCYDRLNAVVAADSDFVVRLRASASFNVQDVLPLTAEDRLAGVQRDWVVTPTDRRFRFHQPVRLVEITVPGETHMVRLLTNRTDLPAALIGLLYRHRWQIELFFRWLKCVVKQRHFMSESPDGMAIQLYVALIGTLLIALEIGTRPNKYDYALLSLVASGLLDYDEAREQMEKRRAERARANTWQKAYNARKKVNR
jgi:hypothetical protein